MILNNITREYLNRLVDSVVAFYKSDFDIDRKMILNASRIEEESEREFFWLLRPCGTWLFLLKNTFVEGTSAQTLLSYYTGESDADKIKVFYLKVKYNLNEKYEMSSDECYSLIEEMCSLNLDDLSKIVDDKMSYSNCYRLVYENGEKVQFELMQEDLCGRNDLGKFLYFEPIPFDGELVKEGRSEVLKMGRTGEMSISDYIKKTRNENCRLEAERIRKEIRALIDSGRPNSPSGTHYMVEISWEFAQNAGSRDMDELIRLLSDLDGIYMSSMKDRNGIYVLVPQKGGADAV